MMCAHSLLGANHFLGSTSQDSKSASLMPAIGARVFANGIALLLLNYKGNREAIGVLTGCMSLMGVLDMWVVWKNKGKAMLTHGIATAVCVAMSYTLLNA